MLALQRRKKSMKEKNIKEACDIKVSASKEANKPEQKSYFVSAESAQHTADNSAAFRKHLGKCISESAKEGMVSVDYSVCNMSRALLDAVEEELRELGYEVGYITDDQSKIIAIQVAW